MKLIPKEAAEKIYDLLVEHGGAPSRLIHGRDVHKESFVHHATEVGITEYRCVHALGFGGKFWNRWEGWDVTCYQEDETPERKKLIKKLNKLLEELWAEYDKKESNA